MKKREIRRPFVRQFYRRNKLNFVLAFAATVVMAFANLVISWLLQQIMDLMAGSGNTLSLGGICWVLLGIVATIILVGAVRAYALPRFFTRAMGQYKDYAYSQLLKKNISTFSRESTSTYLSALSNDANSIEVNYLEKLFDLVMDAILCVGAFLMMLWYSPLLTLIALVLSLLPLGASLVAGKHLARREQEVSRKNDSFLSMVKDGLAGFSVVKSFKAEKDILRLFSQSNSQAEDGKRRRMCLAQVLRSLGSVAGVAAQFGVFLVAAALALQGDGITPGVASVFLQLSGLSIMFLQEGPEMLANRRSALALMDKLADSLAQNVREEGAPIPKKLEEGIQVRDLSFSYQEGEEVLHHVNAQFQAGKSYALVGASGSGKSTLLNLLMAGHSGYSGETLWSPWWSRTCSCSTAPCGTTSPCSGTSRPSRSSGPRSFRALPPSSRRRARATSAGRTARGSPAASASGCPSPGVCCGTPPCFWWTRPPLPWIRRQPSASPAPFWIWRASPGWWSPTPWTRRSSAGTTAFWSCTTAAWWRPASSKS